MCTEQQLILSAKYITAEDSLAVREQGVANNYKLIVYVR